MIFALCAVAFSISGAESKLPVPMSLLPAESSFRGARPRIADLNEDGRPDLIAGTSDSVAIALQSSEGDYGQLVEVPGLALDVFAVDVGDLNGDGHIDLVATVESLNEVRVSLGLGDGSFMAPVAFAVGSSPQDVQLGDLNGDGDLDAVTINELSNDTTVLIGQGDGTFAPTAGPSATLPLGLTLAEATGDSDLDLLVAQNAGVSIHAGNGDGTFDSPTLLLTDKRIRAVVVADFDGDSIPDLACSSETGSDVFTALGAGDGNFELPQVIPVDNLPRDIAATDRNGDGFIDLAVANQVSHTIRLFDGVGDGTFVATESLAVRSPVGLTSADLDGDGQDDLAVATTFPPSSILMLGGTADGSFATPSRFSVDSSPLVSAVGDLNGDSIPDVVIAGRFPNKVSALLGVGDGSFGLPTSVGIGFSPSEVRITHLDGDGDADLVVLDGLADQLELFQGQGDGSFVALGVIPVGFDTAGLVTADLDQNGTTDIAVAAREPTFPNSLAGRLTLFFGAGDGTFGAPSSTILGYPPKDIEIGDFDEDSIPDLILTTNDGVSFGELAVVLGQGGGAFTFPPLLIPAGIDPTEMVTGDFDLDGHTDVALVNNDGGGFFEQDLISVLLGQGDGTFLDCGCDVAFGLGSIQANPPALTSADVNGDGFEDILAPISATRRALAVFEGVGDGTFEAPAYFLGPNQPTDISTGDLNGDGRVDVVVPDDAFDTFWVYSGSSVVPGPTFYCDSTLSSSGCLALIGTSNADAQPVSGAADYLVTASGVQETQNGLLFAGVNGQASIPFGSGILCMNPPLKRGPIMNSGGVSPLGCAGAYATTVNTGAVIPVGLDAGPGNSAQYQYYYRDPANGPGQAGSALSNAVELCFSVDGP